MNYTCFGFSQPAKICTAIKLLSRQDITWCQFFSKVRILSGNTNRKDNLLTKLFTLHPLTYLRHVIATTVRISPKSDKPQPIYVISCKAWTWGWPGWVTCASRRRWILNTPWRVFMFWGLDQFKKRNIQMSQKQPTYKETWTQSHTRSRLTDKQTQRRWLAVR